MHYLNLYSNISSSPLMPIHSPNASSMLTPLSNIPENLNISDIATNIHNLNHNHILQNGINNTLNSIKNTSLVNISNLNSPLSHNNGNIINNTVGNNKGNKNSTSKRTRQTSHKFKNELCRVCGDKASGYHYKAITCEGCKVFFLRCVATNAQFNQCHSGGHCEMDLYTRRKCQYCRFQKCLAVGMKPECVILDRQRSRQNDKNANANTSNLINNTSNPKTADTNQSSSNANSPPTPLSNNNPASLPNTFGSAGNQQHISSQTTNGASSNLKSPKNAANLNNSNPLNGKISASTIILANKKLLKEREDLANTNDVNNQSDIVSPPSLLSHALPHNYLSQNGTEIPHSSSKSTTVVDDKNTHSNPDPNPVSGVSKKRNNVNNINNGGSHNKLQSNGYQQNSSTNGTENLNMANPNQRFHLQNSEDVYKFGSSSEFNNHHEINNRHLNANTGFNNRTGITMNKVISNGLDNVIKTENTHYSNNDFSSKPPVNGKLASSCPPGMDPEKSVPNFANLPASVPAAFNNQQQNNKSLIAPHGHQFPNFPGGHCNFNFQHNGANCKEDSNNNADDLRPEQRKLIEKLVFYQDQFELPSEDVVKNIEEYFERDKKNNHNQKTFMKMAQFGMLNIQLIIEFSKRLPGFQTLNRPDQITILKACMYEVMLIKTARRYDLNTDTIVCCDNRPYTRDNFKNSGIVDVCDSMFDFCRGMATLKVDNAEYALLTAVCLFQERPSLIEPRKVEWIQEYYLDTLRSYVQHRRPAGSNTLARLLVKLRDLREINNSHSSMLYSLKVQNFHIPPLMAEVWDLTDDILPSPIHHNGLPVSTHDQSYQYQFDCKQNYSPPFPNPSPLDFRKLEGGGDVNFEGSDFIGNFNGGDLGNFESSNYARNNGTNHANHLNGYKNDINGVVENVNNLRPSSNDSINSNRSNNSIATQHNLGSMEDKLLQNANHHHPFDFGVLRS
ncbi:unnamed protein product [Gordionus sp. m RMFG-2023]